MPRRYLRQVSPPSGEGRLQRGSTRAAQTMARPGARTGIPALGARAFVVVPARPPRRRPRRPDLQTQQAGAAEPGRAGRPFTRPRRCGGERGVRGRRARGFVVGPRSGRETGAAPRPGPTHRHPRPAGGRRGGAGGRVPATCTRAGPRAAPLRAPGVGAPRRPPPAAPLLTRARPPPKPRCSALSPAPAPPAARSLC